MQQFLLYKHIKIYYQFYIHFHSNPDLNNYIKKNTMNPFLYFSCKYIILYLCKYIVEQLGKIIEN